MRLEGLGGNHGMGGRGMFCRTFPGQKNTSGRALEATDSPEKMHARRRVFSRCWMARGT